MIARDEKVRLLHPMCDERVRTVLGLREPGPVRTDPSTDRVDAIQSLLQPRHAR
jgi:hypothetical protein